MSTDYLKKFVKKIEKYKSLYGEKYKKWTNFTQAIRAGRLLPQTFLKKHETVISELFPIFVTTPENILQRWRTQNKPYFDYLIVDEASQMFVETGLALMSLATYKIIAGDDQQLQPSTWFSIRDQKREEERDTAEDADSLLNYAQEKDVYSIMLKKNYRSESAPLMAFSSKHFYQSELEVVDQVRRREKIPIKVINCKAGKWIDSKNEKEVNLVLEQCLKNLNRYPKIIILAFNKVQRDLIESKIIEDDKKYVQIIEKWNRGNLIIKNIENIQGDEADLVIMSVVYDATTHTAGTYVARKGGAHALNVAISRAKKKNIIIKSVTAENIRRCQSKDFRVFQNWLKFLDLSPSQQQKYCVTKKPEFKPSGSDSTFEEEVAKILKDKIEIDCELPNIILVQQYPVGSLRIDLAFVLKKKNRFILGIEVDGFFYHKLENYHQDKSRQNFLETKGYDLYRIKEINWKNKPI